MKFLAAVVTLWAVLRPWLYASAASEGWGEPSDFLVPRVSLKNILPSEVTYHQILPVPNEPFMAVVLASWIGFQLRFVAARCLIATMRYQFVTLA